MVKALTTHQVSNGFRSADEEFLASKVEDGSTAVVCVLRDKHLHLANVGDAEGIIVSLDNGVPQHEILSFAHKARDPQEIDRIRSLGGFVFGGRVCGSLAVSRAFGDGQLKKPFSPADFVSIEPHTKVIPLTSSHRYILLACDGFWDVITHPKAATLIHQAFQNPHATPEDVAKTLVQTALANKTTDNVTVLVLRFNWEEGKTQGGEQTENGVTSIAKDEEVTSASGNCGNGLGVLRELPQGGLTRSYCYLGAQQVPTAALLSIPQELLPCWVPQELISRQYYKESGVEYLNRVEAVIGSCFLWATEFANLHATFLYAEEAIIIDDEYYGGPEQYFQLMKSFGTSDHETCKELMKTADSDKAYEIGRTHQVRSDWESVKVDVMRKACFAKFSQSPSLKELLLSTGSFRLVQLKPSDGFWGSGANGDGKNMLGVILMEVRDSLRKEGS